MNQVDGVYTKQEYNNVLSYLQATYPQIALFWLLGCDTGYRVSDILRLRVSDITPEGHIDILERKTGKRKSQQLSSSVNAKYYAYIAKYGLSGDDYIFADTSRGGDRPVTRQYVWRIIRQAGQMVGLPRLNLEHIALARHMHGRYSLVLPHSTKHSEPSITSISQLRSGMSKSEWNSFLRGLME